MNVNQRIAIDSNSKQLLDGPLGEGRPAACLIQLAVRVGGIHPLIAVPGNDDEPVAGDRHHRDHVAVKIDRHHHH